MNDTDISPSGPAVRGLTRRGQSAGAEIGGEAEFAVNGAGHDLGPVGKNA